MYILKKHFKFHLVNYTIKSAVVYIGSNFIFYLRTLLNNETTHVDVAPCLNFYMWGANRKVVEVYCFVEIGDSFWKYMGLQISLGGHVLLQDLVLLVYY